MYVYYYIEVATLDACIQNFNILGLISKILVLTAMRVLHCAFLPEEIKPGLLDRWMPASCQLLYIFTWLIRMEAPARKEQS